MVSYLQIPWQILHFHSWCQRRRGQLISVPEKASCGGKKSEHSSELHWSRSVYPVSCDNIHLSTYNLRSWGRRMASWRPGWATEWGPVFKNKQNCFGLILCWYPAQKPWNSLSWNLVGKTPLAYQIQVWEVKTIRSSGVEQPSQLSLSWTPAYRNEVQGEQWVASVF